MSVRPKLVPSAHVDTFARDHLPPDDAWPPLIFPAELSYPDRLNAAAELLDGTIARLGADRPATITPGGPWSYGELRDHVNQLAHFLVDEAKLVPGNRVLLRMPNNEWLVAAWLAVLKAGCVAVTSMPVLRATELRTIHEIAADLVQPRRPPVRRRLDRKPRSAPGAS